MSDTPRTREETRWYETGIVHACFAAQLERELNAANARIAELKQELNESNETIRLQHKLITTAEKRCFDKYKEELTASNERIKRLEEAGNDLDSWLDRETPVTIRTNWRQAKETKP